MSIITFSGLTHNPQSFCTNLVYYRLTEEQTLSKISGLVLKVAEALTWEQVTVEQRVTMHQSIMPTIHALILAHDKFKIVYIL